MMLFQGGHVRGTVLFTEFQLTLLREGFGRSRNEGRGFGESRPACWGLRAQGMRFLGGPVLRLPDRGKDSAQNQKLAGWVRVFKAVHTALDMLRMRLKVGRG